MDLPRSVMRNSAKKDLEHVRRYLLQLTAAHICPRNDDIFQNDVSTAYGCGTYGAAVGLCDQIFLKKQPHCCLHIAADRD